MKTIRKLQLGVFTILILSICFCITSFALVYADVSVENNLFQTGTVKINLNDGKAIINEQEYIFEPGMTVEKEFFIENQSTWDVYYRVYFDNIKGEQLADILDADIFYEDKLLFSGKISELTKVNVPAADDELLIKEKRYLKIRIHFPEEVGNEAQNLTISFDIAAQAVQTKNNPDKLFD